MTKVFAHRGSKGTHPENTLSSFKEAISCGSDGIELDVHLSKDHHLIVIHDETVNRTTNGTGKVQELTLKELKELDAGRWFDESFTGESIPTLEEVTNLLVAENFTGTLNIEIKTDEILYEQIEERIHHHMTSCSWPFRYLYSSFNFQSIEKMNRLAPEIDKALILFDDEEVMAQGLYSPFVSGVHPKYTWVKKQTSLDNFPKDIRPWTVNKKGDMLDSFKKGLTAIHTDYPKKAIKLRKEWLEKNGK